MKQVFANHDFNVVKNGMSSTYDKSPYQEEHEYGTPVRNKIEYGGDDFYIKAVKKVKGRNKKIIINIF